MTAPSGSRNAVAGRAPRDDGDAEVHDDPKLRAMRAVWLAMRDEDPPAHGLAELLAAARRTAGTMQARPTLWRRLATGLRRPPALAFATAMVLIGGAVIVGRRGVAVPAARSPDPAGVVRMEPAPPATPVPSRPDVVAGTAVPGEAVTQPGSVAGRPAAAAGSGKVEPASERTGRVEGAGKAAQAVTSAGQGGERTGSGTDSAKPASVVAIPGDERRAAGSAPGTDRKDVDVGAADAVDRAMPRGTAAPKLDAPMAGSRPGDLAGVRRQAAAPKLDAPPAGPTWNAAEPRAPRFQPPRAQPGSSDDLDGAASTAGTVSSAPPPPAEAVEATKKAERVAPTITRQDKEPAAPAVPLEQLYKQCEVAARRGDCAAVRRMVGRIAKSDRGYRARVAKGSPVARCLAE